MTTLSPSCRCPGASRGEMGPPNAPEVSTPTLPAGCKDRWEDWAPRRAASLSAFRTFSKRRITSTSYTHFINSRPLAKPKLSWAFKNRRVFALLRVFFCFVFCFFGLLFYVFLRVLVIHVFFFPTPCSAWGGGKHRGRVSGDMPPATWAASQPGDAPETHLKQWLKLSRPPRRCVVKIEHIHASEGTPSAALRRGVLNASPLFLIAPKSRAAAFGSCLWPGGFRSARRPAG